MKTRAASIKLGILLPALALGRAVQDLDISTLIERSTLAFVGRVNAISPSGIRTTMSYPTWKGVTFEWLDCAVEVVEPIKGVNKGNVVRTAMLSAPGGGLSFNPPGMVAPEVGKAYLLCLAPSTVSNTFAAVTAPWDDNRAIFVLDRNFWRYGDYRKNGPRPVDESDDPHGVVRRFVEKSNERYGVLWSLVDDNGSLTPKGAEKMRHSYRAAITSAPPADLVIHLQWETFTTAGGWQWDIPKGQTNRMGAGCSPITMPGNEKNESDAEQPSRAYR